MAKGIDTAITYRYLAICFLDKAHVTKMKFISIFLPVDWILLFKH